MFLSFKTTDNGKDRSNLLSKVNKLFYIVMVFTISISLIQISYAQVDSESGKQVTLSNEMLNDPMAQDILKKIEQTKKMIAELEQKQFERTQAEENLRIMRDISLERLEKSLDEWERLWEKHSSRNAFEKFVSKKPSYVQGVFWDQFEFKEQKVNAGRMAMNKVLANGGSMLDAKQAYNNAAATKKIELIEMNAQFNIKHNLAYAAEQQLFNSTGQVHFSPLTKAKLTEFYTNYKLQPSYILANSGDATTSISKATADTNCDLGHVLVSHVTSGTFACVDNNTANKWKQDGIKGIVIFAGTSPEKFLVKSKVKTNPGTVCNDGHQVIYDIETSEYQCVSESTAQEKTQNNSAEIHTLVDYILNKDKQKIKDDKIFDINQEILEIQKDFDRKRQVLESQYEAELQNTVALAKKEMQKIINEYKIGSNLTKEDVTKIISDIRKTSELNKEKILKEKSEDLVKLELRLKAKLLESVRGYENNSKINVDWEYLSVTSKTITSEEKKEPITVSLDQKSSEKIVLDGIAVVNSFGQKFDDIKSGQIVQISSEVTNLTDSIQDFVYTLEIKNDEAVQIQPTKWITGKLDPDQRLNVGLSWIPEQEGKFTAGVYLGNDMDSVSHVADIELEVSDGSTFDLDSFCKDGYELLFKYSDNSPICLTTDTASKLIKTGLVFS